MRRHSGSDSASEGRELPIQRFRSLDEARRALWVDPSDPALPNRIRRLWRFSARLARLNPPRGVQRFRSIEEANAERGRQETERVRALQAERQATRTGP
jgi:hypothetical protein